MALEYALYFSGYAHDLKVHVLFYVGDFLRLTICRFVFSRAMCRVGTRIQLCTCAPGEIDTADAIWILSGPPEEASHVMGTYMPPLLLCDEAEQYNEQTILAALNAGNCFDFPYEPRENDKLLIEFRRIFNEDDYLIYAFIYHEGAWIAQSYSPFDDPRPYIAGGRVQAQFHKNSQDVRYGFDFS